MKRIDPNTKQSLKAREIYQNTFLITMGIGFIVLVLVSCVLQALLRWIGFRNHVEPFVSSGFGASFMVAMTIAHLRAVGALRRAGLLREASEIIPRTATTFEGPTLQVWENSIWGRLFTIAFFLLMIAGCVWLCLSKPVDWSYIITGAVGATMLILWSLIIIFNIRRPELRLDDEGITSFQNWIKPRFVRWEDVAALERKSVQGLPPDYSLDKIAKETIFLRNSAGRILLALHCGPISGQLSAPKQQFVAEIERRLTAATSSPKRENFDDAQENCED